MWNNFDSNGIILIVVCSNFNPFVKFIVYALNNVDNFPKRQLLIQNFKILKILIILKF